MIIGELKDRLPRNSLITGSVHQLQPANFWLAAQPILSSHTCSAEIKEYSISIVIPFPANETKFIQQQMILDHLMAQMINIFNEVSLFPRLSQYKTSVSQSLCQQELLLKAWTNQELLLEHFEEVVRLVSLAGQVLEQDKMIVLVEGLGEQLMIRLITNTEQDQRAIA